MKVISLFIFFFVLASALFFKPAISPKVEVSKQIPPSNNTYKPLKLSDSSYETIAQPCHATPTPTNSNTKESALIISNLINPYGNEFSQISVSTITSRLNLIQKNSFNSKQNNTQQPIVLSDNMLTEIGDHYSKLIQVKPHATHTNEYWTIVHSIESKQGKRLFRPKNRAKNCTKTEGPCGHHQLNLQALKDIGCNSLQCRTDREDYKKSLAMSIKLHDLNHKRISKNGYQKLNEYQSYLIHQQGASGARIIFDASIGKKLISKKIRKNMANNSPFSSRQLQRMGSKLAANKFLQYWEKKWQKEINLIAQVDDQVGTKPPTLNKYQLRIALNMQF